MAAKKKAVARPARAVKSKLTRAAKAVKPARPVKKKVQPIPKGYHVVTPHIVVRGADQAIAFYKKAFGAKEKGRMATPDGNVIHAEIQIGDSRVMLAEEMPQMGSKSPATLGGSPSSLMIYTRNADALFDQAVKAGAVALAPVADMFWGDRYGRVQDPFGHQWAIATHKEDLTPKQMEKRMSAFMGQA